MTVTLMGIVILPIIQSAFTSIKASSTSREVAEVETVLQNAADRVNRAPLGCNYDAFVQAAALSKGWSASRASATYQYYTPKTSLLKGNEGDWTEGACPNGVRSLRLVQLVTISVTSESGLITRKIKVVKSDI